MIPTNPEKSWKVLKFKKSPGKVLEFFCSETVQKRFLKHQHFLGFLCMLNPAV